MPAARNGLADPTITTLQNSEIRAVYIATNGSAAARSKKSASTCPSARLNAAACRGRRRVAG
eukprot:11324-Pyramimonas_sp.AAC.1